MNLAPWFFLIAAVRSLTGLAGGSLAAPPPAPPAVRVQVPAPEVAELPEGATYSEAGLWLEERREGLAARLAFEPRERVLAEARAVQVEAARAHLLPAWLGTAYAYDGTSEVPGEGRIACGYLVSTVLRDLGHLVDRVPLAQSAAEQIVRTVAEEPEIARFWGAAPEEVVASVAERGEGLYVIGLDTHVGFLLVNAGGEVELCHASKRRAAGGVVCEEAASSPSMRSRYHVVGDALGVRTLEAWLHGEALPTAQRPLSL